MMFRQQRAGNDTLDPEGAEVLGLALDTIRGANMVDLEAERESAERYLATARGTSVNVDTDYSPTAQLLERDGSACHDQRGRCSSSDDGSDNESSFGGFSQPLPDFSQLPGNENTHSLLLLDFRRVDREELPADYAAALNLPAYSKAGVHIHRFFDQNVPSSVRLAEWEHRNLSSPWPPTHEELMDRVIERVEIVESEMNKAYMSDSGASSLFIPTRRRRGLPPTAPPTASSCPAEVRYSSRSLAPPSHDSLVRRYLE